MTTKPRSMRVSDCAYSMLRSTSVVITTTGASGLTEVSPVSRPTFSAPCTRARSACFWLLRALMGVV